VDAGRRTAGKSLSVRGHNALIDKITPLKGVSLKGEEVQFRQANQRTFRVSVTHLSPAHRYCGDEGLVTFDLDKDTFTISLESLAKEGPIWFEGRGAYIALADDKTDFKAYKERIKGLKTLNERIKERPEQTYLGAFLGQPHPHAVSYNVGCKHNRQRFWIEANGDILLRKLNVLHVQGKDTDRFKTASKEWAMFHGDARFVFGLAGSFFTARFPDPAPVLAYNIHARRKNLVVEQKSFAVPLMRSIFDENLAGDDTTVCLVRFRFTNAGDCLLRAAFPILYSPNSGRECPSLVPRTDSLDELFINGSRIEGVCKGEKVLRCTFDSTMEAMTTDKGVVMSQTLAPGESCDLVLKIPFIALEEPAEFHELSLLDFDACYEDVKEFWRQEQLKGAQLDAPDEHLTALHKAHLAHVQITDFRMPDDPWLINTSVGTSTYGNFSNESCMIVQELDQRGFHEDARRRLELWVKYQGTAEQPGNFTDYDGMFFGAGGFQEGAYNQHHGWVLWCLCEHLFLTGDKKWFSKVADAVIAGADWVFRQRRNTMQPLPHSRGWEHGFLPAGSLEDVTDFHYWLSTNSLTWRGAEWAARALEAIEHPEAKRVRKEADAYRKDLRRGFDTMRQHSPLVRLRNGKWIPQFPSRLYRRGRDIGWIRQLLEGAVYLLISGLYDANGEEGGWILDDYQDNLYVQPPYGYFIQDFEANWFNRGGFSIQPNLLAGLLPHLDRDEPEIYIRMFYNAWVSCYRESINAMIEHPAPVLGWSNAAHFKTSDEANAIMWLRYILIYGLKDVLHFGRAVPRKWFAGARPFGLHGVSTRFGDAGIQYEPLLDKKRIGARLELSLREPPKEILVRFRHPEGKAVKSVMVNGKRHKKFDKKTGDVNITGMNGKVHVEVTY